MSKVKKSSPGDSRNRSRKKPSAVSLAAREDDIVLVPVDPSEPDTYLVLGESWPAQFGLLMPTTGLTEAVSSDLTARLSQGTGLANIGLQGLNGLQSVQGLVKLAPETLALIRSGAQPLVSGGFNLGTLQQGGRIVAQVRWLPATGASVLGVATALGPAIALAAIQFQLASMDRKLDKIIDLSNEILLATRLDKWTEVQAHVARIKQLGSEAERLGKLSDTVFLEAHGSFVPLDKGRRQLTHDVLRHRQSLMKSKSAKDKREWFKRNGEAAYQDVQCLLLASCGCVYYEAMRAEHTRSTDPKHAEIIYEDNMRAAAESAADAGSLLAALERQLQLISESPGSERIYLLGYDRAPDQVRGAATQLSEALSGLGFPIPEPSISANFKYRNVDPDKDRSTAPIETLSLHLAPDEELTDVWRGTKSFLCLTSWGMYACPTDKPTVISWLLAWSDTESVRVSDGSGDWNLVIKPLGSKPHTIQTRNKSVAEWWVRELAVILEARQQPKHQAALGGS